MNKKLTTKKEPLKSDGFFKTIMNNEVAAREFLIQNLPQTFTDTLDLSKITLEKDSFVEEDLKRRSSDVIFSIKTKENNQAFVFTLVEHQSISDYWISMRLQRYVFLLLEKYKNKLKKRDKQCKLPLVATIVVYNGKAKYNAPMNFWDLFSEPKKAKELLGEDYKLVNLQETTDEEIISQKHIGMLNFFMKHIHEKNMLALWERFLNKYPDIILIDRENGYVYTKMLLWYTDTQVPADKKADLNKLILTHLKNNEGEEIMYTIADSYRDEGINIGEARGIAKGEARGVHKTAANMLKENADFSFVSRVTGLSNNELLKIKSSL